MAFNSAAVVACSPLSIPSPVLFGAEILSLEANQVNDFSRTVGFGLYANHGAVDVQAANICNVSIAYTHPGQNDKVKVQMFLPTKDWNGRMQAIGGNGWQTGLNLVALAGMEAAIGEGYASLSTDSGLGTSDSPTWGLLSPGNTNRYLLQNLASTSLNDLSILGKDRVNSYYGTPPVFSYWNGCSQGGRQGMMLAQRFPEAFDGIVASAPAINWSELFVGDLWPYILMNTMKTFPRPCEMQAITQAAVTACDGNDGLVDGLITEPDDCAFDPTTLVGTTIQCTEIGRNVTISMGASILTQAIWEGPMGSSNSSLFPGPKKCTTLSSTDATSGGTIALTTCSSNGTCVAAPLPLLTPWVRKFVLKDESVDLSKLTRGDFERLLHASVNEYSSVLDTNDPDLSAFRARGGKIVGYHGLRYFNNVTELGPNIHDFYRMFFSPGLGHCFGGNGAYPADTFDAMRSWVENGTAPDVLNATFVGTTRLVKRTLCPYPLKQTYDGVGNATEDEGFSCK